MVLVGVFLASGLAKLRDRNATATAAGALGVPIRFTGAVANFLPAIELSIAAALVLGLVVAPVRRGGAAAAVALLGAFTIAMARTLRRGQTPLCHCFGSTGTHPIGTDSLVRNGALVALSVVVGFG